MTSFTHHDLQELLGAFALDALEGDECDVVEAHLAGCPRCRAEVQGHRETAALLAQGGERAPEGLWDRIAESLDEAPPELDFSRIAAFGLPPFSAVDEGDELAARRGAGHRRRTIPLRAASVTMAVAAALALFLGVGLGHRDGGLGGTGRVDKIAEALQAGSVSAAARAAMADPESEQVKLASSDGKAQAQVVRLANGTGYMVPTNLASLPAGRVYQLWAIRSDAKISLGVIGPKPEISSFRMAGPVQAYAVTEEAAGGVAASRNQPVLVGWLDGQTVKPA